MPRKNLASATAAANEDQSDQLAATVEALTTQVEALTGQVEVLRQVLDEIREDLQWALQNDKLRSAVGNRSRPFAHITSLPKNPCAEDWEVNRVKPEDLPPEPPSAPVAQSPKGQAGLFD